ncbi:YdeI/OmpD-associated family protein [Yoonia sp. SDW83-1]|uniref:YdeI/OmpD-associated family protein n=1 Tax=Yoonia sp. SDW83-1 TaxID=3366945 RepID=UPI00398C712E
MITDIADYFTKGCGRCTRFDTPDCSTKVWNKGLRDLREICQNAGLTETVKWGHPCYMHAGRNIAIIGAFRNNFRLSFFNAALMRDPDSALERQGENTAHPDMLRFIDNAQVNAQADLIRCYLAEAMDYAEKGINPPPTENTREMPAELADGLDADPQLAEAFAALTPGRQRGYFLHITSAKQSTTRNARIEKCRDRIFAGKGFNER